MSKCQDCGRNFGVLYKKHKLEDGRIVCIDCLEKIQNKLKSKKSKIFNFILLIM